MPRRLVVCADGTWNTADEADCHARTPTNVITLARTLCPVASDGTSQIIYYHDGVGTHRGIEHLLGGALGEGIERNICDCYRFLIQNYAVGDEIFLFGFSRGAYTVRSLAGLIHNSGLLCPEHGDRIPDAFALYRDRGDTTRPSGPDAQAFRAAYAREVRITCIGVWDTVGALGIPVEGLNLLHPNRYAFHDVTLNRRVDNAFQALAIDERRGPFTPCVWEQKPRAGQRLEQVWFAGVHSDVGGGYAESGLSDVAFEWMRERAEECGLSFAMEHVRRVVRPAFDAVMHDSRSLFYHAMPPHVRTIAAPRVDAHGRRVNTCETVHPTAIQRYHTVIAPPAGPYRPENLTAYLGRARAARTPAAAAPAPVGGDR